MSGDGGVLIARDDGVIDVPEAAATPAGLVDAVEQLLDKLLGPRQQQQQRTERNP